VKYLSEQLEMFPDPVRRFGRRKHAERIPCCKCGMREWSLKRYKYG